MGIQLSGRGRRGFRDINVTPLVDVMLVLLVVFMVTAPLLTTGLRIDLPEVQAAQTPVKDARLLVTVTKEEKVLFGERDVTGRVAQSTGTARTRGSTRRARNSRKTRRAPGSDWNSGPTWFVSEMSAPA